MAEFPLDPPLSNVLASVELVCSDEILAIIAMIQTGNIFYRTREEQAKADQKRAKFFFHSQSMKLGKQVIFRAMVFREFCSVWVLEAGAGCQKTASEHCGQVQTGRCECRKEFYEDQEGNYCRIFLPTLLERTSRRVTEP
ncbi:hypothetical protein C1H46_011118 [Malus baccata]|uniref:Uncharacterized protein n=1 Tax=Malus baccata TaxID=106549 RepID=A0A540MWY8_MALBA|nr:hypothetical protein C1H46_011118 [Malus baccata]